MRYLPKSQSDREVMLREIGAKSIDDLFATIPAEYRLKRDLNIPRAYVECEIVDFFRQRAAESAQGALLIQKLLREQLVEITRMDAITLQPAAGAHGELSGTLLIRAYLGQIYT